MANSKTELMSLDGIDEKKAEQIKKAWKKKGGFRSWSALAAAVDGLDVTAVKETSGKKVLLYKVT
jgi:DNA uptake protein ComE-like DNA-binding protein